MTNNTLQTTVDELHTVYNKLNEVFYDGELPMVALTVQQSGKRQSMGWFTPAKLWRDRDGKVQMHEINISAEFINESFMEVMDTMLHEMVHLYCEVNEKKDTSRGNTYHNKTFKKYAELHGFYFPDTKPHKKHGWAFPKLTEEAKETILSLGFNQEAFGLARMSPLKAVSVSSSEKGEEGEEGEEGDKEEEPKKKNFRLVCPECGLKVRATKQGLRIQCLECEQELIEKEK